MALENIPNHTHNGRDAQKLHLGNSVKEAPAEALTTADDTVLSTGGAAVLSTSDSDVIDNLRTRLNELETKMQTFGLLK